jgi:hypothetical protein
MVLNSTFSFFRTLNTNNFKEVHFVDEKYITENVQPYKVYDRKVENRPNIVIFIVESLEENIPELSIKIKILKITFPTLRLWIVWPLKALSFPILLPTEDSLFME